MEFVRSGKAVRKSGSKHFVRIILCETCLCEQVCANHACCVFALAVFFCYCFFFCQILKFRKLNRPPLGIMYLGGPGVRFQAPPGRKNGRGVNGLPTPISLFLFVSFFFEHTVFFRTIVFGCPARIRLSAPKVRGRRMAQARHIEDMGFGRPLTPLPFFPPGGA